MTILTVHPLKATFSGKLAKVMFDSVHTCRVYGGNLRGCFRIIEVERYE